MRNSVGGWETRDNEDPEMPTAAPTPTLEPQGIALQLETAIERLETLVALYVERAPLLRRRFD